MKVNVDNEYSQLKSVVVSSAAYYDPATLAINNETIKYYAETGGVPSKESILLEQKSFWQLLEKLGVNIVEAHQVDSAKGQMFTRDLAFVIGNKFFVSNMKKENRKLAINGWSHIINQINPRDIIEVPSNIYLEGGDVLVDGRTIYVGISERTGMNSINFLQNILGNDYKIIPLKLKPKFLHLDVVFTIINPNLALVYRNGLEDTSYQLLDKYSKIEVSKQEQFELATNVLVVDPKTIIMNSNHRRIEQELKKLGFNVIALDLTETAKDGGAFRCTTCPIERQ